MATPKGLQDLFQSSGTSTILREDIIPKIYLPLNGGGTVKGNVTVNGTVTATSVIKGAQLTLNNGANKNLDFVSPDGLGGGFILAGEDHTTNSWVKVLTVNSTDTVNGLSPVGTLISYAGTSIPNGWLLCNGSAVSRTTYARLFNIIGTKYGTGNGSSTFNLPNCNGRFIEGTTVASSVGSYVEASLPDVVNHYHGWGWMSSGNNCGNFVGTSSNVSFPWIAGTGYYGWNGSGDDSSWYHGSSTSTNMVTTGSNTTTSSQRVQPPSMRAYILIKY